MNMLLMFILEKVNWLLASFLFSFDKELGVSVGYCYVFVLRSASGRATSDILTPWEQPFVILSSPSVT